MTLGEKIREARIKANLNQLELASKINEKYIEYKIKDKYDETVTVGNTAISNWGTDRSEPDAATIGFICEITDTEPNHIYDFNNNIKYENISYKYTDEETGLSVYLDLGGKKLEDFPLDKQKEYIQQAMDVLYEKKRNL